MSRHSLEKGGARQLHVLMTTLIINASGNVRGVPVEPEQQLAVYADTVTPTARLLKVSLYNRRLSVSRPSLSAVSVSL